MTPPLFDLGQPQDVPSPAEVAEPTPAGKPRLRIPRRDQVEMHWDSLDQLLEPDHPARTVWDAVSRVDLKAWLGQIKAVERHAGRDATDPRLLLSLWVYATLKAIGSARELDRLCRDHIAFRWLCGGVSVNYHTLSDFRSSGGDALDELLTQVVAALMDVGLVTMDRVAQDGMKVRAGAGKGSFRRRPSLERLLDEAREQVATLKRLAAGDPGELTRRQHAARERAAEERQERLEEALRQREELQRQREAMAKKSGRKAKPEETRASTTDPEARTMKFADGGYRPGYNVQFATDTATGLIVGVEVTNAGTDNEQLAPMIDQLDDRYKRKPKEVLVDGGYVALEAIDQASGQGCTVYAPVKDAEKQKAKGVDPYARKKGDSDAVAAWRARMGGEEARPIYGLRCQTAEWVNAQCRNRGMRQMPVRGRPKCRMVAVLYAIAHNLMIGEKLRAAAAAGAT